MMFLGFDGDGELNLPRSFAGPFILQSSRAFFFTVEVTGLVFGALFTIWPDLGVVFRVGVTFAKV